MRYLLLWLAASIPVGMFVGAWLAAIRRAQTRGPFDDYPVTPETIAAARAYRDRERQRFTAETGLDVAEDGQIVRPHAATAAELRLDTETLTGYMLLWSGSRIVYVARTEQVH